MPPALLRFARAVMLLVLFAAAGGHWMALQSLAWAGMLISYSQNAQFSEAVSKTFDGQHPCSLCKKIAHAQGHESPTQLLSQENQTHFLAPPTIRMVKSEGASWEVEVPQSRPGLLFPQPAAPPPRSEVA